MDKFKDLLSKLGASQELTEAFISELSQYEKDVEAKYLKETKERLAQAKKVCLEEVESEKARLASKVEIFLESQVNRVERGAARRLAIEEAKSTDKLKNIKMMLEGIKISGDSGVPQAREENLKLRRHIKAITEEKNRANATANKASQIATKALKQNAILESKWQAKTPKAPAKKSAKPRRLDESRKPAAQPRTTRKTLTETVVKKKPAAMRSETPIDMKGPIGSLSIDAIANTVED